MGANRSLSSVDATGILSLVFVLVGCADILGLGDFRFTEDDEAMVAGAAGSAGMVPGGGSSSGDGGAGASAGMGGTTGGAGVQAGAAGSVATGGTSGSGGSSPGTSTLSCNGRPGADMACGASSDENCCASFTVEGGTWDRFGEMATSVSTFRLDEFEVTAGRFRNFVEAVVGGYRPPVGSGVHTHLPGGMGVGEVGWLAEWDERLPADLDIWNDPEHLACPGRTWSRTPAGAENLPIACVDWFQARAFCAWDEGFLPSQLELSYAADGGDEQRRWPWGDEPLDPSRAVYGGVMPGAVGSKPTGDGRWEQSDLIGNVWEWPADNDQLLITCFRDCLRTNPNDVAHVFGGGWSDEEQTVLGTRFYAVELTRHESDIGFRCARAP